MNIVYFSDDLFTPGAGNARPPDRTAQMSDTDNAASKFDDKLGKLIKRARKQHGLLWPAVVAKLELARADVKAMIKVYDSGPK